MNKLKAKLKKQGGFTLVEMLIVVGIIAILVAVSIPVVSSSLEKAKHATDAANERAAKAAMMIKILNGEASTPSSDPGNINWYYDAIKGDVVAVSGGASPLIPTTVTPYGKHKSHNNQVLGIKLKKDGSIDLLWGATDSDLCGNKKNTDHSS